MIAEQELDCLFLFLNPLTPPVVLDDCSALHRLCTVHQLLLGTNYRTANAILRFLSLRRAFLFDQMSPEEQIAHDYNQRRKEIVRNKAGKNNGDVKSTGTVSI